MKKIKKAVIPVAGLGTRFLPITKTIPKELLPIVDKPAIQYVIEEAVASGLTEIILVTAKGKGLIEEHFRTGTEYDNILKSKGKSDLLKDLNELCGKIKIRTVFQSEPKGLGHAVGCAKDLVGDEWFVVLLPDVLIDSKVPCTKQMIDVWNEFGKAVLATEHSPKETLSSYGVIGIGRTLKERIYEVKTLVEKPKPEDAPSDLTIVGRYLLPPEIFTYISKTEPGAIGEIQITDALQDLAKEKGMIAYEFEGFLHDTGDKAGYLEANNYYSAKRV